MKDLFKHLTSLDPQQAAAYLAAVSAGVERGSLPLSEGKCDFELRPQGLIDLALKIRRKNGRARLELALSWSEEVEAGEWDENEERP